MRLFSLKQRVILFTLITALVLVLILVLIIYPAAKQIISLQKNIVGMENNLEQNYDKAKKLKKTLNQLNQVKIEIAPYNLATVSINQQLQLITDLEQIASSSRIDQSLSVELISPKPVARITDNDTAEVESNRLPEDARAYPKYFHFSFLNNALFSDHLTYLKTLEQQPYYMVIDNLQWEKRRNDLGTSTPITLRFDGIIYVQP